MIYLIIILLLTYYTIIHDIKGISTNKKLHYRIMFWIFFLLAGLRHGIGGDTYQFRIFWDLLPTWGNANWAKLTCFRYEMGWVMLSFILKSIFGSFVSLQLLLSWILNVGIFKVVKRYSPYPFLVLLLFFLSIDQFFHIECTFMRQAYAVAIFLVWGVEYLNERKYIKYFIVIAVCTLMHFSAAALAILPLLWDINFKGEKGKRRFMLTFIVLTITMFIAFNYTSLAYLKGILRLQNALEYADERMVNNEIVRFFNVNYYLIIYYIIIIWGSHKYNFKIPFKGAFLFGLFTIIFSPYVGDFKRLMFFIIIFIDISLAIIIARFSRRRILIFISCILLFAIGSNILNIQRYSNKDNTFFIYPYYFWFEEEPISHKRYFIQRENDNHTIPHQIYDRNK